VQDVLRRPLASLPDSAINPHLLPAFQHFRLVLGKVRLHREGGFRQVDSLLQVVEGHSSSVSQMYESLHYREQGRDTSMRGQILDCIHAR
jgi:hypothetical protein